MIQCQAEAEENEEAMVVVGNTAIEPHAVVVEPCAARLTQLAVFGALWDDYLEGGREDSIIHCTCTCIHEYT